MLLSMMSEWFEPFFHLQSEHIQKPETDLYGIKQYLRELESQRRCESMLPLDVFFFKKSHYTPFSH